MPRSRYEQLVDVGIFGPEDRVELLDGLLVTREPQGGRHATAVALVRAALEKAFGRTYYVREEKPIALDERSEPEPDVVVVPGRPRDYRDAHPSQPVLVVEVADTSLALDRLRKGSLYARAGIADYWVVNLIDEVLEVYREPARLIGARRLPVRLGPSAPAQRPRQAARRAPSTHPLRGPVAVTALDVSQRRPAELHSTAPGL